MSKLPTLPIKRQKFADAFISGNSGTQSAIIAGFSKNGASVTSTRLLKNPKIKEYISLSMERASEKSEVSASYVLTTIQQTMEQCKQPIDSGHLDSQGQPVMVPKATQTRDLVATQDLSEVH
jgi:phage terminase small subunit